MLTLGFVYVLMRMFVCVPVRVYAYVSPCLCVCMYALMHTRICVCAIVCMSAHMFYADVCDRVQVCFRVCLCVLLSSNVRMCVLPMCGHALVCAWLCVSALCDVARAHAYACSCEWWAGMYMHAIMLMELVSACACH